MGAKHCFKNLLPNYRKSKTVGFLAENKNFFKNFSSASFSSTDPNELKSQYDVVIIGSGLF